MTAVDPDFVRGLLAGFTPGSLAVLNDRQLAALCDWDDPRCVAVLEAEAARRDALDAAPEVPVARPVGRRRNAWLDHVLDEYRAARHAWELAAEEATSAYATEMAEYRELHPAPTFKAFLRGMART